MFVSQPGKTLLFKNTIKDGVKTYSFEIEEHGYTISGQSGFADQELCYKKGNEELNRLADKWRLNNEPRFPKI